jgi:hypothetical protein
LLQEGFQSKTTSITVAMENVERLMQHPSKYSNTSSAFQFEMQSANFNFSAEKQNFIKRILYFCRIFFTLAYS